MHGRLSAITIGAYVVVLLLVYLLIVRSPSIAYPEVGWFLLVVTAFLLLRYLSTTYHLDDQFLEARRLVGSRRVALADVRGISSVRLGDLSPTGFFGSWGWRGRMWSPVVGRFDAIYTDPYGLLVTAGDVPLFISPQDSADFARELSRRVRSYRGGLETDVGRPSSAG